MILSTLQQARIVLENSEISNTKQTFVIETDRNSDEINWVMR